MNIEHCDLLSWFHGRHQRPVHKNHAQDCGTLIAMRNQRPAILPWSRCADWLSSFRLVRARADSLLPATEHLPVIAQSPECCWTNFCLGMNSSTKTFRSHARCGPSTVRIRCAHGLLENRKYAFRNRALGAYFSSTTNVVLFEQRLVSRLVLFLDVVQKRTARRHELQQAAP